MRKKNSLGTVDSRQEVDGFTSVRTDSVLLLSGNPSTIPSRRRGFRHFRAVVFAHASRTEDGGLVETDDDGAREEGWYARGKKKRTEKRSEHSRRRSCRDNGDGAAATTVCSRPAAG